MGSPTLLEDLCRLCAQVDHGINLFSTSGQNQNLFIKLKVCVPIQIIENDELTTHLCFKCISKLNIAYDLYTNSIAVQQKIRDIYSKRKSSELINNSVTDNVLPNKGQNTSVCGSNNLDINKSVGPRNLAADSKHTEMKPLNNNNDDIRIQSVLSLSQTYNGTDPLFFTPEKLPEEEPIRKKDRKTVCQYCCKWFPRSVIQEHEEVHLKSGVCYSCVACQQIYKTKESFSSHVCTAKR